MFIFIILLTNCLCKAENKKYIENIQALCNDYENCGILLCCAIMKITLLDDDEKIKKEFLKDCIAKCNAFKVPSYRDTYSKTPI